MSAMHAFVLVFAATVAAAAPAYAADAVRPRGSAFGLVPPPGFVASDAFTGFVEPASKASFLFVELPAASFAKVSEGMTRASLAAQGIVEQAREPVEFGGARGLLVRGVQTVAGDPVRKFLLAFDGRGYVGLINVSLPPAAAAVDAAVVRAALASLVVGAPPTLAERVAALPFTFAATPRLKPARILAGSGVALAFADPTEGSLVIARSASSAIAPGDLARRGLEESPAATDVRIEGFTEMTVAGCRGAEARARGAERATGRALAMVEWVGACPTGTVSLQGVTPLDRRDRDLREFRAVRDSVRLR